MALQEPLINGHVYSWSSVEVQIAGQVVVGVSEVNYSDEVSPTLIYGSDPTPIGRTFGRRRMASSLTIFRRHWELIVQPALGDNFGRTPISVTVQYSEGRDQPTVTDRVVGVITKVDAANRDSTDPSGIALTIEPTSVRLSIGQGDDGVALEANIPASSKFWLSDPTGIEGPDYAPNPWDRVTLAGIELPGVCSVKGVPTLAFDKKKAGGIDGANITVNGYLPGPVEIQCKLWTPHQREIWAFDVTPFLWRKPNKKTNADALAVDVINPSLNDAGITQIVILGWGVYEDTDAGVRTVKIKTMEYVKHQKTNRTKTVKAGATAKLDPHFTAAKNEATAPSKTDIAPGGPPVGRKGGVS